MSSSTFQIILQAKDGTQQVFTAIEQGAKKDAAALKQLGQDGSAGLKQVDTAAEATGRSMEQSALKGAALGALFREMQGTLTEFARASNEQVASQISLRTAIENAGLSFDDYRSKIQQVTDTATHLGFNNDVVRDSFAVLISETRNVDQAMQALSVAEDVARLRHISLEESTRVLTQALSGNVGALREHGIMVDTNATKEEILSQVMERSAGHAEAFANTTAGATARMSVEFHNLEAAVGNAMGGLTPFIALLPGISEGFTLASAALGTFIGEETIATAATAALDVALGPVGLVLAAGAAIFAIYELTKGHGDESKAAEEAAKSTKDLAAALASLQATGSPFASTAQHWADELTAAFGKIPDQIQKLKDAQTALQGTSAPTAIDPTTDTGKKLQDLETQIERLTVASNEQAQAQKALVDVYNDTGTGADLAKNAVANLFDAYEKGAITEADLISGLIKIDATLSQFDAQANNTAKIAGQIAASMDDATFSMMNYKDAAEQTVGVEGSLLDAYNKHLAQTAPLIAANTENAFSLKTVFDNSLQAADAMTKQAEATKDGAIAAAQAAGNVQSLVPAINAVAATRGGVEALGEAFGVVADHVSMVEAAARDQESAFARIERGSTSAAVAFRAFADAQDNLLQQESIFSAQASEYTQQVDAMTKAHDLLAQRQADGVKLTKAQTEFMDHYDEALGRVKGGVDDATISEGLLAEQYALNMEKGDQMRSSLDGVNKTSGDLTKAIRDLIEALDGVPENTEAHVSAPGAKEAQTDVENVHGALLNLPGLTSPSIGVVGAEFAIEQIHGVSGALAALNGQTADTYINTHVSNTIDNIINNYTNNVGPPIGAGGLLVAGFASGGVVRVNEGGQETATLPTGDNVWLPNGSVVWPHASSVMGNRDKGGGRVLNNYGTIHVHANNPDQFFDQLNGYGLAGR